MIATMPRAWRPLPLAFSLTGFALLLIWAGASGYTLDRHTQFVNGTAWSATVIWWQVLLGLAVVPAAAHFWRVGLRDLRRAGR